MRMRAGTGSGHSMASPPPPTVHPDLVNALRESAGDEDEAGSRGAADGRTADSSRPRNAASHAAGRVDQESRRRKMSRGEGGRWRPSRGCGRWSYAPALAQQNNPEPPPLRGPSRCRPSRELGLDPEHPFGETCRWSPPNVPDPESDTVVRKNICALGARGDGSQDRANRRNAGRVQIESGSRLRADIEAEIESRSNSRSRPARADRFTPAVEPRPRTWSCRNRRPQPH